MALSETLHAGSFRGVPFLMRSGSVAGGRKDVVHEFPNTNTQSVEDLGLRPRAYDIVIVVTGEEDYAQKRDDLLAAFEGAEPGVLVHPFYGRVENVKARTYTINEDLARLGDAEVRVSFVVSESDGIPEPGQTSVAEVAQAQAVADAAVKESFAGAFAVDPALVGSFNAAVNKVNNVADQIRSAANALTTLPTGINEFFAAVDNFKGSINTLINTPAALAENIQGLFDELVGILPTNTDTRAAMRTFAGFGLDDVEPAATTASRIQIVHNDETLDLTTRLFALNRAFTAASDDDYRTDVDVEDAARELEAEYTSIRESNVATVATGASAVVGPAVLRPVSPGAEQAVEALRVVALRVLDEQKITAARVITVETSATPVRVLSYQHYGTSSQANTLIDLNDDINVSHYAGAVQMVTE